MGTAVPLEAQEGNKYILTLIMKAFVAFAAIAANPIEATPYDPYQSGWAPYAYVVRPPPPRTKRYADWPAERYAYAVPRTKRYADSGLVPTLPYAYAVPRTKRYADQYFS